MRLSTRAKNVCQEMGLLTLEDMRAASDVDYLLVPRCGKGTLHEIKEFLARDGEPTAEELRDQRRFDLAMDAALAKARLEQQSQT
jgi:DNA-directed RNA polymerase alpha subunit